VITQFADVFEREHIVMHFGFLQADDIGLMLFNQRG
jgi:hypothetical protein